MLPPVSTDTHRETDFVFDEAAIRPHLKMISDAAIRTGKEGCLVITAFGQNSDTGKDLLPLVRQFRPQNIDGMVSFIIENAHPHRNFYTNLCLMRSDLKRSSRGAFKDIVAVLGLVCDFDDANAADHRKRVPLPADYVLETSDGRFQAFYIFNDAVSGETVKPVAQSLKGYSGCDDGTGDPVHVWRIPGCPNWPNKTKADNGRPREPQMVKVVKPWSGTLTSLESLETAMAKNVPLSAHGPKETAATEQRASIVNAHPGKQNMPDEAKRGTSGRKSSGLILDPNAKIPEDIFKKWLQFAPSYFYEIWKETKELPNGKSPSEFDLSLANCLVSLGEPDQVIVDALVYRRRTHGHDLKLKNYQYYSRTIEKARSGLRKRQAKSAEHKTNGGPTVYALTDMGNAKRLVEMHGKNLRYCAEEKQWFHWSGRHWEAVSEERIMVLTADIPDRIRQEASMHGEDKSKKFFSWAKNSESHRTRKNAMNSAKFEPGMLMMVHTFDQESDYLLNVENGTLDLKTGKLRPHRREDYLTQLNGTVSYDPDAKCPLWEKVLEELVPPPEACGFLQRAMGYSLTSDVSEQKFFILKGNGSNGKSLILIVFRELLGNFAVSTSPDVIQMKFGENNRAYRETARLKGKRMSIISEPRKGVSLDEGLIKSLTGGESVPGAAIFERPEDIEIKSKIWILTNHKLEIHGSDDGIWRRPIIVPFNVKIPEGKEDRNLKAKLLKELPGILNWAVEGCQEWLRNGLEIPSLIKQVVSDFRGEVDTVQGFIDQCCDTEESYKVARTPLHKAYVNYCTQKKQGSKSNRDFFIAMEEKGFAPTKFGKKRDRGFAGVCLKPTERRRSA